MVTVYSLRLVIAATAATRGIVGEGDLHKRGGDTNRESDPLLNPRRNEVVSEVIHVRIRGLHAHTALAVHGRSSAERTNQSRLRRDSRRNNRPQAPHRRLPINVTVTILASEVTATEVLPVAVLVQAQRLVVGRVDDKRIGSEPGSGLHLRHGPEQRIRVVLSAKAGLGLDTGPVEQPLNLRAGAGPVEQLILLSQREQVQPALVDLGDEEGCILKHLIGELEEPGDLTKSVRLRRRVNDVEL